MEQNIFTGIRQLYSSRRDSPTVIRIRIRMRDLIDPEILRSSVETTMLRYPYFCVELRNKNGRYVFIDNKRPVVITASLHGVELNSEESNYHMIAFSYKDNRIELDVFHGLTDGTGAYEVIRTLLYYYCSKRYGMKLNGEGIRLVGDEISPEEWVDPVEYSSDLPTPARVDLSNALNLIEMSGFSPESGKSVYSVAVPESEFMQFNVGNNGSPGTMIALFLSRTIAKLYPDAKDLIRIALCVNQRNALRSPKAHHSLVGGVMLEYKDKLKNWPLDRQATAYRGMVFAQTTDEAVLEGVNTQKGVTQLLLSKETDQERMEVAGYIGRLSNRVVTATVSYVGKADFKEAERYIRDFRSWTSLSGNLPLIEMSAVNGRFVLDIIQPFSDPVYVNAFLKELDDNGITYDLQDVQELVLPNIKLPWSK